MHSAHGWLLVCSWLAFWASLSVGVARAEEEAVDTSKITSLTPDEARALVADFSGTRLWLYLPDGIGMQAVKFGSGLQLDSLKALDAATAGCLAEYDRGGGPLSLRGLTALDTDTAKALAKFKGMALGLDGLSALSPDVAAAIAEFSGDILSLQGLRGLDDAAAAALGKFPGKQLVIGYPTTLSPAAAAGLAEFKGGTLCIGGPTRIDPAAAEALAKYAGGDLRLPSLRTLNAAAARALAASTSWDGKMLRLDRLDAATAEELLKNDRWRAYLPNTTVDEATARVLAGYKGDGLCFRLNTLSADTARALAGFEGDTLTILGLTALEADAAAALVGFQGKILSLHNLKTLDADVARTLANLKVWDGYLQLEALDATTAAGLVAGTSWNGRAACRIDEATARVLARHTGDELSLNLATLSPETAEALAAFTGKKLEIIALNTLDAATIKALAAFKGREVNLPHIATLDDDAVAALGASAGHCLVMSRSPAFQKIAAAETLTPDVLQLVCATAAAVTLPKITAFDGPDSVAIAQALAAKKGPLALPNLKKLSPKTLTALIGKEDIEIPLIGTLELIPEPDGGPTDDVVLPEGYEERQRRKR